MALTCFSSAKAERNEVATDGKSEASRGWFIRAKEDTISNKSGGTEANVDPEAVASYPENLAKVLSGRATLNNLSCKLRCFLLEEDTMYNFYGY